MAMSTASLCSFVASNVPRRFHSHLPRQSRTQTGLMLVRCQADQEGRQQEEQPDPVLKPNKASSSSPPPPLPKPPTPTTKVMNTNLWEMLAFSGPAPERINGRLAMIGFVAALGEELASGNDVMAQLMNGGVPWFLGTTVLFSIASLVPLSKGVTAQSKSDGFMTSDAEIWNGRFAMLGLVALVFTEYITGGALV